MAGNGWRYLYRRRLPFHPIDLWNVPIGAGACRKEASWWSLIGCWQKARLEREVWPLGWLPASGGDVCASTTCEVAARHSRLRRPILARLQMADDPANCHCYPSPSRRLLKTQKHHCLLGLFGIAWVADVGRLLCGRVYSLVRTHESEPTHRTLSSGFIPPQR